MPSAVWRNRRTSFAISLAVLYRSDARFESAFLAKVLVLQSQSEVSEAGFTRSVNQNISRFDISVDKTPGVGVMECVGNRRNQSRRIPEGRSGLSNPDRQVTAVDELRDHEAKPVLSATHVMDRHDMGMIEFGENSGLNKTRLDILGASDAFRVRHLDGDRSVEIVIVSKIDPSKSALTQTVDDPVTPDLLRIAVLDVRLGTISSCQVFRLILRATRTLNWR
jgi:hypothetical protein